MTQSPLDLAAVGIYRELDLLDSDLKKLPEVIRPIALLYMFQGMVDNGGFRYPMERNFPRNPPYADFVEAYRRIGATDAAEALEQAVALFPFPHPELSPEDRIRYFDSLGDWYDFDASDFGQLSDKVCGDKRIWQQMDEYVAKHNNEFAPFITQ